MVYIILINSYLLILAIVVNFKV